MKLPSQKLNVKVIAFDLDDTLLNHDLKISPKTVSAIQKAAEKGIYIVLCSGRAENAILPYVRALDIAGTQQGRYLIGINGASVLDLHTRLPIYSHTLASDILKYVYHEAKSAVWRQLYMIRQLFMLGKIPPGRGRTRKCADFILRK